MLGGAGHGAFQFPPKHPDGRGSGDFAGGDVMAGEAAPAHSLWGPDPEGRAALTGGLALHFRV